jgi:hypothetical protein
MSSRIDKTLRKDISGRIKIAMDMRGYTSAMLTGEMGLKRQSHLDNITKKGHITIESLLIIATTLRVNLMWLINGKPYQPDDPQPFLVKTNL